MHAHPELSMREHRTAGVAARHLQDHGYDVTTGVGETGVVAVLRNGEGPVVIARRSLAAVGSVTPGMLSIDLHFEKRRRGIPLLGRLKAESRQLKAKPAARHPVARPRSLRYGPQGGAQSCLKINLRSSPVGR